MAGAYAISIVTEEKQNTRINDGIRTLLNLSEEDFKTVINKLSSMDFLQSTDFQFNYYGELDEMRKKWGAVEKIGLSTIVYHENPEEYTYNQVIEQMENDETLRDYAYRIEMLKKVRNIDALKKYLANIHETNEIKSQYFLLFSEGKSYGDYKKFVEKDFNIILQKLLDNAFKILNERDTYEDFIKFNDNKEKFKINNVIVDESIYFDLLKTIMENGSTYKDFYIPNIEKIKERYDSICNLIEEKKNEKKEESVIKPIFSDEEKEKMECILQGSKDEKFINELTGEDLKKLLIFVNSKTRNIPENEAKFEELMTAGELISPKNTIQEKIINDLADSLKNIQGEKNKATLMYHLINQLHLFGDGNGRTSRTMFEMFANDEFNFYNNENFIHNEKNEYTTNSDGFEKMNSIIAAQDMGKIASFFLYKGLVESGVLDDIETKRIYTSETFRGGNAIGDNLVKIIDSVDTCQLANINRALCDNNEEYSISGLTMLIMDKIKGYKVDETDYDSYEYIVDVSENSTESDKRFSNWTAEDYDLAIKIADTLKKDMLELIIDIFEHPENFKYDGKVNICDYVTNFDGDIDFYAVFEELYINGQANLKGTKTYQNIQELMELLKEKDKQKLVDVQSLGKQVISEISDPTLEDETEKQEQKDIENMQNRETQEK